MDRRRRLQPLCSDAARARGDGFCAVAPSPELRERLLTDLAQARGTIDGPLGGLLGLARPPRHFGFNDATIFPPDVFPPGTSSRAIRSAGAERAPLRGVVRVIVVLVQFSDLAFGSTAAHFQDLFFSTGVMPHGSVREYFDEVSGGLVHIEGQVVGPLTLPQTRAWYANGNFGIGRPTGTPRANIMARDAVTAANGSVDFSLYDNDGNGFVDAFIVVHAGSGGEVTGNPADIWSHKWVLPAAESVDGKQVYAYLTIPQDARIGVCAHELGHLLFGLPDLYDTDGSSEGIGNWCLMAGGSWNGGGDIPAHPSAWCKLQQGWAASVPVTGSTVLSIPDVKVSRSVPRLWTNGAGGSEYFLLENRQRSGYDANLPGDGLLIWHIDESTGANTDENHYKVALMQADGLRQLELGSNRGDPGDPFPGSGGKTVFDAGSNPSSKSHAQAATCVSVTQISASQAVMTARVSVSCKGALKDTKDTKDTRKERKEIRKEVKEARKDVKDTRKDSKDRFEKPPRKEVIDNKPRKEIAERPWDRFNAPRAEALRMDDVAGEGDGDLTLALMDQIAEMEARLASIEGQFVGGAAPMPAEPFIGAELRPTLAGQPGAAADLEDLRQRMAAGDASAKRAFDTLPPSS